MSNAAARIKTLSEKRRALFELLVSEGKERAPEKTVIARKTEPGPRVVSYAQQRLWFLNQLEPENPFYNCPLGLGLKGRVDVAALERSLREVVRRHEVLRTRLVSVDGLPVQVIEEEVGTKLEVVEVSGKEEAERVAREEALRPFDLSRGSLLRMKLLRLGEEEHLLLVTMHHIVSDGWSWGVFLGELGELYEGYVVGEERRLAELPIQYGDFAQWQREWLQGEVLEEQVKYWKEQLEGMTMLQLPTDRVRPAVQSFRGGEQVVVLGKELSQGLKKLGQREGATLFMTALAGFQAMMQRYTGQEDISVGTAIANRNREETEGLIGFFVNTLVLRTDVSGDPTFKELLRRVRGVALGGYGHQDLPFEKLVEELQPERSMSWNPLVQVMFVVQNAPVPEIHLPGLSLVNMEVPTTRFDLEVHLWETGEGVVVRFIYSRDLFEGETIERMMKHYQRMLGGAVENPEERISRLPLMSEEERREVVEEWNGTRREYARDACVHEVFEGQAERTPERVAVVFEGEELSYGELNRRANQVARYLRKRGVGAEELVGIAVERSLAMVVGILGILKAGGAYVPLDVEYPKERLGFMLQDTGVKVLLSQEDLVGRLPEHEAEVVSLDGDWERIGEESGENLESGAQAENLAYVMYTSGSTGMPKGISVPHRGVVRLVSNSNYAELGSEEVILQFAPISFDASTFEIWGALLNGGRLVVYPPQTPSLEELGKALQSNQVNTLWLTAGLFHMMVDEHLEGLRPVRQLLAGGDVLSAAHVSKVLRELPGCEVINGYGPTENTTFTTCYRMKDIAEVGTSVSIGRPISNTQVYVLDKQMQPVPVGVVGEMYIGGDGLARGYWKRPELTGERFIGNPFGEGRLYLTGDLVRYRRDGNLEFVGRADEQVKIRGFRIELGEVEAVLSEHPGVQGCAVVAQEDRVGEKRLVGYVAAEPGYWAGRSKPWEEEAREQVEQWKMLYEDAYGKPTEGEDATFNITGWKSSYTGEGIPAEQMREWLDDTVEQILSYRPRRVLEIGCGTGLLLFRIAPRCEAYWGTDFSPRVLQYVREHLKEIEVAGKEIHLLERTAANFEGLEEEEFDIIILNSVVQYFPSMEYLMGVLKQGLRRLSPGGRIFLGDVRSLPLLETFHTAVQLYQAESMRVKQLQQRIQMQMRNEDELVIDPGFFAALQAAWSQIERVEVRPKWGRARNELTQFRYQVMIQVRGEGKEAGVARGVVEWKDWQKEGMTIGGLREGLQAERPEAVGLANVANARVAEAVKALEILREEDGSKTTVELRGQLARMGNKGVEVEEFWDLEKELPYRVDISWGRHGEDGSYDVLLRRRGSAEAGLEAVFLESPVKQKPWREYGNDPLRRKMARELIPELREHMERKLPEYMVPGVWVLLDELPLTANGKVDRKGLPEPEGERPELEVGYEEAGTETEKKLVEIWRQVLGMERVGVHDNFFDLGGHSLIATQVVSRVREALQIEVPLRRLFESPTVAELAEEIERSRGEETDRAVGGRIGRAKREGSLPLSYAQQRLWFLNQLQPENPFYNCPLALSVSREVDVAALERSVQEIVRRHEVLRTRFVSVDGKPEQVIEEEVGVKLEVVEVRGKEEAERVAREEAQRPFDLRQGPMRVKLLRLGEEEHLLLVTMHHIVSDGWSLGIFLRELGELYEGYAEGKEPGLAELPIQYGDFAQWQREWLQGEVLEEQVKYWKEQLEGMTMLQLPTDRVRPAVQSFRGGEQVVVLGKELSQGLKKLGQREGATLFMTALAGFQAMMQRYTGQEDISVGTAIANRNREETEGLIGFFVNTLVLRTDVSGDPTFKELLRRVRGVALGGYGHQDLPFEKLVEELQPERSMSWNPLVQVMLTVQNAPWGGVQLPVGLTPVGGEVPTTRFDLEVHLWETGEGVVVRFIYSRDLFEGETIERMMKHYQRMLEGAVENPEERISRLPLMSEEERREVVEEWNAREVEYEAKDVCVHELVARQAERTPERVAVVFEGEELSYGELNRRANQVARYLRKRGVGPEVLVGIAVERSLAMVVGILGILKAGGAYVPLDVEYPKERLGYMLADSEVKLLVTEEGVVGRLPEHEAEVVSLDGDWERIGEESGENLESGAEAENLAYVIYTSGSTGKPKGAMVTHHNVVRLLRATEEWFHFNEQDVWTLFHSYAFDFSVWELWGALMYGGRLVVVPFWLSRSPNAFRELLQREKITVLNQTPSAFRQLMQVESEEGPSRALALRVIIFGGEALEPVWLRPWFEIHGDEHPRLVNMYGITETTVHVTYRPLSRADLELGSRSVIGRRIPDLSLYILDKNREVVPIGLAGELYVGGEGLARGYWKRPELTAERFIRNPFGAGRLYKTGDVARYLPGGEIEYLGRADDQVKIRGFRIELGEIEAVLSQTEGVREAVVVAREGAGGEKRLVGYVVLEGGESGEGGGVKELRRYLKEKLPEYMVPGVWVLLDELPLTANGKVDRKGLPEPEGERPELEVGYEEAGTETEKKLVEIWRQVLGMERVGVHDNFFDLGGHSLIATQVVSRVREALQIEVPLRRLFESPTVAELAEEIERSRGEETDRAVGGRIGRAKREGSLPLSYAQQRLWFLNQLQPENPFYNCPLALSVSREVDVAALERSVQEIVRRHEVLRTRFVSVDGKPEQVIEEEVGVKLEVVEVRGKEEAERVAREEAQRPFDLRQGPMRVKLLRLGEEEHLLLVTMHHIVSDGWSLGIFLRELGELYEGYAEGKEPGLAELPIQYGDFAQWQREWLQGEVLEEQVKYWKEQLEGMTMLQLPTDRVRPAVQSFRGGEQVVVLGKELSQGLKKLGQREGATLFMTALAGFQAMMQRYTGQEDISVGTAIANRNREETEGLIGFFVNTLVLRTDVSGDPTFKELLRRVRGVALGGYGHQDLPFEKLVEELQPERSMSWNPLVQVMLTVQNAPWGGVQLPVGLTPVGGEVPTTRFDLEVHLWETGEGVVVRFIYSRDLFEGETIERMMKHYQRMLEGAVENPEERISRLPLMSEEERREVVEEWNAREVEYEAKDVCVHELVARQAERTPERVAVVFEGEELSYGELNRRANQVARYLRKRGVGPEVLVGIAVERSLAMVVGILGILKAGGAYVPLDVEYPKERLGYMLADSEVKLLVTEEGVVGRLPEHEAEVVSLDGDWERIGEESGENLESGAEAENLAYVIYTSGSTGKPKGAMNQHGGLSNRLLWMQERFELGEGDRVLQKTPISFDVSVWEILWPLMAGARLVVARPGGHRESGYLAEVIEGEGITTLHFVPSMLQAFLQEEGLAGKCGSVRQVMCSGEALGYELQERFFERVGGAKLHNLYGPTEAGIDVTWWECERGSERRVVPIGRPVANTAIYVLDERGAVVPVGVAGELHIGGVQVGRGYWKRPELTAERFVRNPYGAGRLYKTGDVARYLPGGEIEYLGRADDQVKIRGFRIELGEIEAVLSEHRGVQGCVVVAREDRIGEKRLVGYVVVEEGEGGVTGGELRRYLKEKLPEYMVPGVWVLLDELPLTANGKVDRRGLPEPEGTRPELESGYVEAGTETEKLLAEIWTQVLGVERVGVHDNFFDLGGDSILSLQIISRANQAGMGVRVQQLFQNQTIAELARVAESGRRPIEVEQGVVTGEVALTPIQHWFFEQDLAEAHHWNQAILLETAEEVEADLLQGALERLVEHHDAMRLRFQGSGLEWRQFHAEAEVAAFSVLDLSEVAEEEQGQSLERAIEEVQASLNLQQGPLFRAVLVRMRAGRRGRLLMVAHHLVMDGVSWRILLADLAVAYEQLSRGEGVRLPLKTTSYQEWAKRLNEYAQSAEIREQQRYWLGMEVGKAGVLPVDYAGGGNREATVETVTAWLTGEETTRLLQQVPEVYHTQINDVLLTALAEVLGQWTGAGAVLIDVEGHGREEMGEGVDVSRTVGWFTTVYPVVLESEWKRGAGEALKSLKEQLRAIPSRGIGYGLLRYLGDGEVSRRLAELPRVEVLFNYLGQFGAMEGSVFSAAAETCGASRSPRGERRYRLEITGGVFGGQLQMSWMYSRELYRRETITGLADEFLSVLRELITHCLSPEAGGYTPSDFPLAQVNQEEMDRVIGGRQREIEDVYALSSTQEGMLFHMLYAPQSGVYFQQLVFRLRGELKREKWEQAWREVVARHASLRTSFAWEELEHAVQVVHQHVEVKVAEQDWSAEGEREQRERLAAYLKAEQELGFDLRQAPLMRWTLIRVGEEEYQFVWSWSHLLLDGWCLPVILKEVFSVYWGLNGGERVRLAESNPYRNYIRWLGEQDLGKAEGYWREALKGFKAPTRLGMGKTVRNGEGYGQQQVELGAESWARVQGFARQQRLTVNTLVQAGWGLLLSRYSGEKEVVFGATVAGRPGELAGVETMVGVFINTLPVRVRVGEEEKVRDWLQRLQAGQVEMRQYEYAPLVEVQGWSEVPRGLPLFESILVFENYPLERKKKEEGKWEPEVVEVQARERTNYPLTIVATVGDQLELRASYERGRFEDEAIGRLLGQLKVVLEAMVEHAEDEVLGLPLMSEEERREVVEEWNAREVEYEAKDVCVHELVARQAERTPERVAVVFEGEELSYGELNRRANQVARYLRKRGVGPEVLVGIAVERSLAMVVGILGILKAGGAYVPLDVEYPKERLGYMLADSEVKLLVTEEGVVGRLPEHEAEVVSLDGDWERIGEESGENLESGAEAENLAYVIYTSGSTGKPKGAMNQHGGLSNRLLWMQERFELGEGDRVLQKTPISFDVSVWEILWPLMAGARLVVARPGGHRESGYLAEVIEGEGITTLHFVPSMLQAFLQEEGLAGKCGSVRQVMCSGEALGYELQERFFERVGGAKLHNLYGPTEAGIDVTWWECERGSERRVVPIGRPVANTAIYVLDERGAVVPVGVAGELHIGGVQVGRGYWKRPELTAERFVRNPYGAGRLYKTGDVARYLPGGEIEYLGRADDQVKIRGFRIELGEIEAVLSEHRGVQGCVVVAREDRIGEKRLVGYVVVEEGEGGVTGGELRRYLKEKLPEYMVPGVWVLLDELPLTANGKVDRRGLPEPEGTRPELESGYVEAGTETEKLLAEIWTQVLGVERVGVHDNFFDLGGQSLIATQVVSRTRKALNIDLPLRRLFETPTVAELAEVITRIQAEQTAAMLASELAELQALSEAEAQKLLEDSLRAGLVQ